MLTPAKDLVKNLKFRAATEADIFWINEHYEVLNFKPSSLPEDEVILATSMGRPVAVGRLTGMTDNSCELGGVFVLETFRRLGVARKICDQLLAQAREKYKTIYCIPLPHLVEFYKSYGFEPYADSLEKLPEALREKYGFCQASHKVKILLKLHC